MAFIEDFINTNYILPLCKYYTLPGTLTYGIILVAAVALVYKLLQKLEIKIDKHFFYALLPFIIFGGWTRALRDHNLYDGWWWCSPPIYFLIFALAFGSLLVGVGLQRKFKFAYWTFRLFGFFFSSFCCRTSFGYCSIDFLFRDKRSISASC